MNNGFLSRTLFKVVHWVIICTFIPVNSSYPAFTHAGAGSMAAPSIPAAAPAFTPMPIKDLLNISIPEAWGSVKERFEGKADQLVILSQDIHANFEAQKNFASIMEFFQKGKTAGNIELVGLEGAASEIDPSILKIGDDETLRTQIIDQFIKEGYVNGSDSFLIFTKSRAKVIGVENPDLYRKDLSHFRKTQGFKKQIEEIISQMRLLVANLKSKIYTPQLQDFAKGEEDHDKGKTSFTQYCKFMADQAKAVGVNVARYENFERVMQTIAREDKINHAKVDAERKEFLMALQKKMVKEDLAELVSKSLYFRVGRISSQEFYDYLQETAKKKSVDLAAFPNLSAYMESVKIYSKLDMDKLFFETEQLADDIKDKLYTNAQQKQMDTLIKQLNTLHKLVNLELSRRDLTYFRDHKTEIEGKRMVAFLQKMVSNAGLAYSIPASWDTITDHLSEMEGFYDVALQRDDTLTQNTLGLLKEMKKKVIVLVCGGFHTQGVTQRLKAKNISYMVITPRITQPTNEVVYLSRMMDEETPLAKLLASQGNRLAIPDVLCAKLGNEVTRHDVYFRFAAALVAKHPNYVNQVNEELAARDESMRLFSGGAGILYAVENGNIYKVSEMANGQAAPTTGTVSLPVAYDPAGKGYQVVFERVSASAVPQAIAAEIAKIHPAIVVAKASPAAAASTAAPSASAPGAPAAQSMPSSKVLEDRTRAPATQYASGVLAEKNREDMAAASEEAALEENLPAGASSREIRARAASRKLRAIGGNGQSLATQEEAVPPDAAVRVNSIAGDEIHNYSHAGYSVVVRKSAAGFHAIEIITPNLKAGIKGVISATDPEYIRIIERIDYDLRNFGEGYGGPEAEFKRGVEALAKHVEGVRAVTAKSAAAPEAPSAPAAVSEVNRVGEASERLHTKYLAGLERLQTIREDFDRPNADRQVELEKYKTEQGRLALLWVNLNAGMFEHAANALAETGQDQSPDKFQNRKKGYLKLFKSIVENGKFNHENAVNLLSKLYQLQSLGLLRRGEGWQGANVLEEAARQVKAMFEEIAGGKVLTPDELIGKSMADFLDPNVVEVVSEEDTGTIQEVSSVGFQPKGEYLDKRIAAKVSFTAPVAVEAPTAPAVAAAAKITYEGAAGNMSAAVRARVATLLVNRSIPSDAAVTIAPLLDNAGKSLAGRSSTAYLITITHEGKKHYVTLKQTVNPTTTVKGATTVTDVIAAKLKLFRALEKDNENEYVKTHMAATLAYEKQVGEDGSLLSIEEFVGVDGKPGETLANDRKKDPIEKARILVETYFGFWKATGKFIVDMKPDNVMFDPNTQTYKIIDKDDYIEGSLPAIMSHLFDSNFHGPVASEMWIIKRCMEEVPLLDVSEPNFITALAQNIARATGAPLEGEQGIIAMFPESWRESLTKHLAALHVATPAPAVAGAAVPVESETQVLAENIFNEQFKQGLLDGKFTMSQVNDILRLLNTVKGYIPRSLEAFKKGNLNDQFYQDAGVTRAFTLKNMDLVFLLLHIVKSSKDPGGVITSVETLLRDPALMTSIAEAAANRRIAVAPAPAAAAASAPSAAQPIGSPMNAHAAAGQLLEQIRPMLSDGRNTVAQLQFAINYVVARLEGKRNAAMIDQLQAVADIHAIIQNPNVNKETLLALQAMVSTPEFAQSLLATPAAAQAPTPTAPAAQVVSGVAQELGRPEGNETKIQQDRYVNDEINLQGVPNGQGKLMAVMDGHGKEGEKVAQAIADALTRVFKIKLKANNGNVEAALKATVAHLNTITEKFSSGSTLTVVYVSNDRAHVAVIGDSPAVIVGKGGKVVRSPEHNVRTNPAEYRAAQARGAQEGYQPGYITPDIRVALGMQLTRALGDKVYSSVLSREAEIYSVELDADSMVILGSDGILHGHQAREDERLREAQRLVAVAKSEGAAGLASAGVGEGQGYADNATAIVWNARSVATPQAKAAAPAGPVVVAPVAAPANYDSIFKNALTLHADAGKLLEAGQHKAAAAKYGEALGQYAQAYKQRGNDENANAKLDDVVFWICQILMNLENDSKLRPEGGVPSAIYVILSEAVIETMKRGDSGLVRKGPGGTGEASISTVDIAARLINSGHGLKTVLNGISTMRQKSTAPHEQKQLEAIAVFLDEIQKVKTAMNEGDIKQLILMMAKPGAPPAFAPTQATQNENAAHKGAAQQDITAADFANALGKAESYEGLNNRILGGKVQKVLNTLFGKHQKALERVGVKDSKALAGKVQTKLVDRQFMPNGASAIYQLQDGSLLVLLAKDMVDNGEYLADNLEKEILMGLLGYAHIEVVTPRLMQEDIARYERELGSPDFKIRARALVALAQLKKKLETGPEGKDWQERVVKYGAAIKARVGEAGYQAALEAARKLFEVNAQYAEREATRILRAFPVSKAVAILNEAKSLPANAEAGAIIRAVNETLNIVAADLSHAGRAPPSDLVQAYTQLTIVGDGSLMTAEGVSVNLGKSGNANKRSETLGLGKDQASMIVANLDRESDIEGLLIQNWFFQADVEGFKKKINDLYNGDTDPVTKVHTKGLFDLKKELGSLTKDSDAYNKKSSEIEAKEQEIIQLLQEAEAQGFLSVFLEYYKKDAVGNITDLDGNVIRVPPFPPFLSRIPTVVVKNEAERERVRTLAAEFMGLEDEELLQKLTNTYGSEIGAKMAREFKANSNFVSGIGAFKSGIRANIDKVINIEILEDGETKTITTAGKNIQISRTGSVIKIGSQGAAVNTAADDYYAPFTSPWSQEVKKNMVKALAESKENPRRPIVVSIGSADPTPLSKDQDYTNFAIAFNGKLILVDPSRETIENLRKMGLLDQVEAIYLTHIHNDHIGGLTDLVKDNKLGNIKLIAAAPVYDQALRVLSARTGKEAAAVDAMLKPGTETLKREVKGDREISTVTINGKSLTFEMRRTNGHPVPVYGFKISGEDGAQVAYLADSTMPKRPAALSPEDAAKPEKVAAHREQLERFCDFMDFFFNTDHLISENGVEGVHITLTEFVSLAKEMFTDDKGVLDQVSFNEFMARCGMVHSALEANVEGLHQFKRGELLPPTKATEKMRAAVRNFVSRVRAAANLAAKAAPAVAPVVAAVAPVTAPAPVAISLAGDGLRALDDKADEILLAVQGGGRTGAKRTGSDVSYTYPTSRLAKFLEAADAVQRKLSELSPKEQVVQKALRDQFLTAAGGLLKNVTTGTDARMTDQAGQVVFTEGPINTKVAQVYLNFGGGKIAKVDLKNGIINFAYGFASTGQTVEFYPGPLFKQVAAEFFAELVMNNPERYIPEANVYDAGNEVLITLLGSEYYLANRGKGLKLSRQAGEERVSVALSDEAMENLVFALLEKSVKTGAAELLSSLKAVLPNNGRYALVAKALEERGLDAAVDTFAASRALATANQRDRKAAEQAPGVEEATGKVGAPRVLAVAAAKGKGAVPQDVAEVLEQVEINPDLERELNGGGRYGEESKGVYPDAIAGNKEDWEAKKAKLASDYEKAKSRARLVLNSILSQVDSEIDNFRKYDHLSGVELREAVNVLLEKQSGLLPAELKDKLKNADSLSLQNRAMLFARRDAILNGIALLLIARSEAVGKEKESERARLFEAIASLMASQRVGLPYGQRGVFAEADKRIAPTIGKFGETTGSIYIQEVIMYQIRLGLESGDPVQQALANAAYAELIAHEASHLGGFDEAAADKLPHKNLDKLIAMAQLRLIDVQLSTAKLTTASAQTRIIAVIKAVELFSHVNEKDLDDDTSAAVVAAKMRLLDIMRDNDGALARRFLMDMPKGLRERAWGAAYWLEMNNSRLYLQAMFGALPGRTRLPLMFNPNFYDTLPIELIDFNDMYMAAKTTKAMAGNAIGYQSGRSGSTGRDEFLKAIMHKMMKAISEEQNPENRGLMLYKLASLFKDELFTVSNGFFDADTEASWMKSAEGTLFGPKSVADIKAMMSVGGVSYGGTAAAAVAAPEEAPAPATGYLGILAGKITDLVAKDSRTINSKYLTRLINALDKERAFNGMNDSNIDTYAKILKQGYMDMMKYHARSKNEGAFEEPAIRAALPKGASLVRAEIRRMQTPLAAVIPINESPSGQMRTEFLKTITDLKTARSLRDSNNQETEKSFKFLLRIASENRLSEAFCSWLAQPVNKDEREKIYPQLVELFKRYYKTQGVTQGEGLEVFRAIYQLGMLNDLREKMSGPGKPVADRQAYLQIEFMNLLRVAKMRLAKPDPVSMSHLIQLLNAINDTATSLQRNSNPENPDAFNGAQRRELGDVLEVFAKNVTGIDSESLKRLAEGITALRGATLLNAPMAFQIYSAIIDKLDADNANQPINGYTATRAAAMLQLEKAFTDVPENNFLHQQFRLDLDSLARASTPVVARAPVRAIPAPAPGPTAKPPAPVRAPVNAPTKAPAVLTPAQEEARLRAASSNHPDFARELTDEEFNPLSTTGARDRTQAIAIHALDLINSGLMGLGISQTSSGILINVENIKTNTSPAGEITVKVTVKDRLGKEQTYLIQVRSIDRKEIGGNDSKCIDMGQNSFSMFLAADITAPERISAYTAQALVKMMGFPEQVANYVSDMRDHGNPNPAKLAYLMKQYEGVCGELSRNPNSLIAKRQKTQLTASIGQYLAEVKAGPVKRYRNELQNVLGAGFSTHENPEGLTYVENAIKSANDLYYEALVAKVAAQIPELAKATPKPAPPAARALPPGPTPATRVAPPAPALAQGDTSTVASMQASNLEDVKKLRDAISAKFPEVSEMFANPFVGDQFIQYFINVYNETEGTEPTKMTEVTKAAKNLSGFVTTTNMLEDQIDAVNDVLNKLSAKEATPDQVLSAWGRALNFLTAMDDNIKQLSKKLNTEILKDQLLADFLYQVFNEHFNRLELIQVADIEPLQRKAVARGVAQESQEAQQQYTWLERNFPRAAAAAAALASVAAGFVEIFTSKDWTTKQETKVKDALPKIQTALDPKTMDANIASYRLMDGADETSITLALKNLQKANPTEGREGVRRQLLALGFPADEAVRPAQELYEALNKVLNMMQDNVLPENGLRINVNGESIPLKVAYVKDLASRAATIPTQDGQGNITGYTIYLKAGEEKRIVHELFELYMRAQPSVQKAAESERAKAKAKAKAKGKELSDDENVALHAAHSMAVLFEEYIYSGNDISPAIPSEEGAKIDALRTSNPQMADVIDQNTANQIRTIADKVRSGALPVKAAAILVRQTLDVMKAARGTAQQKGFGEALDNALANLNKNQEGYTPQQAFDAIKGIANLASQDYMNSVGKKKIQEKAQEQLQAAIGEFISKLPATFDKEQQAKNAEGIKKSLKLRGEAIGSFDKFCADFNSAVAARAKTNTSITSDAKALAGIARTVATTFGVAIAIEAPAPAPAAERRPAAPKAKPAAKKPQPAAKAAEAKPAVPPPAAAPSAAPPVAAAPAVAANDAIGMAKSILARMKTVQPELFAGILPKEALTDPDSVAGKILDQRIQTPLSLALLDVIVNRAAVRSRDLVIEGLSPAEQAYLNERISLRRHAIEYAPASKFVIFQAEQQRVRVMLAASQNDPRALGLKSMLEDLMGATRKEALEELSDPNLLTAPHGLGYWLDNFLKDQSTDREGHTYPTLIELAQHVSYTLTHPEKVRDHSAWVNQVLLDLNNILRAKHPNLYASLQLLSPEKQRVVAFELIEYYNKEGETHGVVMSSIREKAEEDLRGLQPSPQSKQELVKKAITVLNSLKKYAFDESSKADPKVVGLDYRNFTEIDAEGHMQFKRDVPQKVKDLLCEAQSNVVLFGNDTQITLKNIQDMLEAMRPGHADNKTRAEHLLKLSYFTKGEAASDFKRNLENQMKEKMKTSLKLDTAHMARLSMALVVTRQTAIELELAASQFLCFIFDGNNTVLAGAMIDSLKGLLGKDAFEQLQSQLSKGGNNLVIETHDDIEKAFEREQAASIKA